MQSFRPKLRGCVMAAYVAVQLAVLSYGLYAPDHAFGFQMFNQSSRIHIELYRQIEGRAGLVPIVDGAWEAPDNSGQFHWFRWRDRVRYGNLNQFGRSVHASYGLEAQLYRLQAALDDVATHIDEDSETTALVAIVEARRNGRKLEPIRLTAVRK
jgi:hypothetical protein